MIGNGTTRTGTRAEALGLTAELGLAIASLAGEALAADRLAAARELLEGLVVVNPREPLAWALLSSVLRRQGQAEAARLCAEVAVRLAPRDERARLARAEALLLSAPQRERGRAELRELAAGAGPVGDRARTLVAALGS